MRGENRAIDIRPVREVGVAMAGLCPPGCDPEGVQTPLGDRGRRADNRGAEGVTSGSAGPKGATTRTASGFPRRTCGAVSHLSGPIRTEPIPAGAACSAMTKRKSRPAPATGGAKSIFSPAPARRPKDLEQGGAIDAQRALPGVTLPRKQPEPGTGSAAEQRRNRDRKRHIVSLFNTRTPQASPRAVIAAPGRSRREPSRVEPC